MGPGANVLIKYFADSFRHFFFSFLALVLVDIGNFGAVEYKSLVENVRQNMHATNDLLTL